MKRIYSIIFLIFIISQLQAQTTFNWAKQFSGTGTVEAASVGVDPLGNVYTVGNFKQVNDFDPGVGVFNLTPATAFYTDIFITKMDPNGNFIWAKSFGGNFDDAAISVAVDDSGNVVVGGYFFGACDFNPGAGVNSLTSTSNTNDAFIAKYDSSGNFKWVRRIGNSGANESVKNIVINANNEIFFCGELSGTIDFDFTTATANVASTGGTDVYVAKYTPAGYYVWANKAGGTGAELMNDLELAPNGDLLFTGSFNGTADFDPTAATNNLISAGPANAFVCRWNSSGALVWAKSVAGFDACVGTSVGVDNSNNVYVGGNFVGTADFDPAAATAYLTSAGSTDQFIWKLSSAGVYLFAKSIGGNLGDNISAMHVNGAGFITTVGGFSGTIDFDPNAGVNNLISAGSGDVFIARYNANGVYVWAYRIGDVNFDGARQIAVDASGFIYTVGRFQGTVDFNHTAGINNLSTQSATTYGMFVHKMIQNFATPVVLTQFEGQMKDEFNELKWQTSSEENNDYFELQRSDDAQHFIGIAKITGAGTTQLQTNYRYEDFARSKGVNYYRLKQVDIDGQFTYSEVVELRPATKGSELVSVHPNPSSGQFNVLYFADQKSRISLNVTDIKGALVYEKVMQIESGEINIPLNLSDLPEGVYILRLDESGKKQFVSKLFKQK